MLSPFPALRATTFAALCALTLPMTALAQHSGHGTAPAAEAPSDASKAEEVKAGDLTLTGAFTRATLPNAPVAGGFLTITNTGAEDDLLIGGSADFAGRVEVHEMAMQGDIMQMRQLTEGLPIPAGATVTLAPGGLHLMFMALSQPLKQGEAATVTLDFARAGKVAVPLAVLSPGAKSAHDGH